MKTEIEQNAKEINRILNTTIKKTNIIFEEIAISLIERNPFYATDYVEQKIYKRATEEHTDQTIKNVILNVLNYLSEEFKETKYKDIVNTASYIDLTLFILVDVSLNGAYATHLIDYTDI